MDNIKTEKEKTLYKLSKKEYQNGATLTFENAKNPIIIFDYFFTLIWNNDFLKAYEYLNENFYKAILLPIFELEKGQISYSFLYENIFILLISKKEYSILYNFFTNEEGQKNQSKDYLKPIWYALMYYMRDQHPNEYLKMGEELRETVEEIIAKVEQMAIDYAVKEENVF